MTKKRRTATSIEDTESVAECCHKPSRYSEASPKPTVTRRSSRSDLQCGEMSITFVIQRFNSVKPPQFSS